MDLRLKKRVLLLYWSPRHGNFQESWMRLILSKWMSSFMDLVRRECRLCKVWKGFDGDETKANQKPSLAYFSAIPAFDRADGLWSRRRDTYYYEYCYCYCTRETREDLVPLDHSSTPHLHPHSTFEMAPCITTSYMAEIINIRCLSATVEASSTTRVIANRFIRCFNPLLKFKPQHHGTLYRSTYTENTTKARSYARR